MEVDIIAILAKNTFNSIDEKHIIFFMDFPVVFSLGPPQGSPLVFQERFYQNN